MLQELPYSLHMLRNVIAICTATVCSYLAPGALGNNGVIAIALPTENITIDGDLSDWPADAQRYPIERCEYGDNVDNKQDLRAHFRVGYEADTHRLYVAVEVDDDSSVTDRSPHANWNTQDGCDIYVDGVHGPDEYSIAQYSRFGCKNFVFGSGQLEELEVAVAAEGNARTYEWCIDLGDTLTPMRSLGFDVAVCDKDSDGTFSWVTWGPGTQKKKYPDSCGDVLLLNRDTPFGKARGQVKWRDPSDEVLPTTVRFESHRFPQLRTATLADSQGEYSVTLPAGSYSITVPDTMGVRMDNSIHVELSVDANQHVVAEPLLAAPLPKPALIPDVGVLRRPDSIDTAEIQRFIEAHMEYYKVPGLSIALLKDGAIVYSEGFGVKHRESGESVDRNTVFNAASMTKVVFACLVNRLVERGILGLDTPLHTYLPFEAVAHDDRYNRITARMVLNHSTGFPNWFSGKPEIEFDPGTAFGYSGIGFVYLGNVVRHLTGESPEDLVQAEVFAPLGITQASLIWQDRFDTIAAFPHPDSMVPQPQWKPDEPNVASSMYTSAEEYMKFLVALAEGQGMRTSTLQEMLRPQNDVPAEAWGLPAGHKASYGLGIVVEQSPQGTWYSHGGSNAGFTSKFELHDEGRTGYVFLVNNQKAHSLNEDLRAFLITGRSSH